jgi:hypothetical protein
MALIVRKIFYQISHSSSYTSLFNLLSLPLFFLLIRVHLS